MVIFKRDETAQVISPVQVCEEGWEQFVPGVRNRPVRIFYSSADWTTTDPAQSLKASPDPSKVQVTKIYPAKK